MPNLLYVRRLALALAVVVAVSSRAQQQPIRSDTSVPDRMTRPIASNWRLYIPYTELSPAEIFAVNEPLAKSGNHEAAYEVAWAYLEGYGVDQDLSLAEHWFDLGAMSSFEKHQVADQYVRGRYFTKSLPKAEHWLLAAGDNFSLFDLAKIYRTGALASPDTDKAVSIYLQLLKSADGHARLAEFELGNLVIDGRYSSGDPRLDLKWAREITQELIGQEQLTLQRANRAEAAPEIVKSVLRSAASYDVDLAQARAALFVPDMSAAETYAWLRLAGQNQANARSQAKRMASSMSPAEQAQGDTILAKLEATRLQSGAFYRDDDPLRSPEIATLKADSTRYSGVDQLLRLAFYEESREPHDAPPHAMDLYRRIRDERSGLVRLNIGVQYLRGQNGFPKNSALAARWFFYAVDAGSAEARVHLKAICNGNVLQPDELAASCTHLDAVRSN